MRGPRAGGTVAAMRRLPVPAVDLLLSAAFLAAAWAELLVWDEWSGEPRVVQAVGMSMVCAALAIRRTHPLAAVVVVACGTLVAVVPGEPPEIFSAGIAGMVIAYSCAAALDGRSLVAATTILAATLIVRDIVDPDLNGADIGIDGVFYAMAWAVGRVMRRRERRTELVAQVADDRAGDLVREERARIARELHDVIAHGMSVMVVQADAARHGVAPGDEETRAALAEIERTGRESLREMRRLLGLLRDGDEDPAALTPQPGLGSLEALVQSVRQAGLPVDLRVSGDSRPLSPGVDVAAYRIVQEALTNALRHAGPARATVEIGYGSREVTLRIEDTGRGAGETGSGGHGLVGMRERALLYGGSFTARRERQGFVVAAALPLETPR